MVLTETSAETAFGALRYFRAREGRDRLFCVFIHGLGADKGWFEGHHRWHDLSFCDWIVPDLLGHGSSARPTEPAAYRMEAQAGVLVDLLRAERVRRVLLIAHSMGGPIALRMAELLRDHAAPAISGLVYAEGNIDENDAFMSGQVAEQSWEQFSAGGWDRLVQDLSGDPSLESYLRTLKAAGSRTVHASSLSLVPHSRRAITVPLIESLPAPKLFLFGERNRGRFTSEATARGLGEVRYVPGAGHAMHLDNPAGFWELTRGFCGSL